MQGMTVVEPNALQGARIAFIGAGVMAESMLGGLLSRGLVSADQVVASHPRADRRAKLEERFGVTTTESNLEAAQRADLVLLTIKPQVLKAVAKQLHGQLSPGQVVISVIAGANVNTLRKQLGHSTLVRVMPNTPSQIGEGMIVWYCADEVTDAQAAQVKTALSALGVEMRVDEEKYIDMATALSATGPTYIFMMMEALIDAGVHMGFPRRIAEEIVLQTVSGSVEFARQSGKHMAELRNMVTSPGGTSAEAIYQMEKGGLRTVFSKSVYAAFQRTQTLAAAQEKE